MGHFGTFTPFNYPTNQPFDQCKKETYKFHVLREYTKSHTHMAYSYQEMMHTSVQAILRPSLRVRTLWPKKSKFLKNTKDTWRYHHFTPVY